MVLISSLSLLSLLSITLAIEEQSVASKVNVSGAEWWQQRNYDTIYKIYNTTIYPNNQLFLKQGLSAIPEGLFDANTVGRISPIGNFSGAEDSAEYFFGLTPPVQPPLYDTWTKASLVHFTSGCPEVASSVVYGETTGVNESHPETYQKKITTIKQVAFWRFNEQGAVIAYEAWLPNLQRYTNKLYGRVPSPEVNAAAINRLCTQTQALCTQYPQWDSQEHCVKELSSKNFGSFDDVWGDNVVCRNLHIILTPIRPEHHCPHVGPTGGGKCIDVEYNDVYFDDEEVFGQPPGQTFVCPDIKQQPV